MSVAELAAIIDSLSPGEAAAPVVLVYALRRRGETLRTPEELRAALERALAGASVRHQAAVVAVAEALAEAR